RALFWGWHPRHRLRRSLLGSASFPGANPEKPPKNFGASRKLPAAVEFSVEPDASVSPVFVSGCAREAEQLRGLLDGQPGEVTEFDQLAGVGFLDGEGDQGVVEE